MLCFMRLTVYGRYAHPIYEFSANLMLKKQPVGHA
jgi:hypothetical protein